VIGLLLLKHIYGLSDEGVCERWVHDPYFQYFTGLLAESLRVAHQSGALRTKNLARVTVDTTVQPKNITFSTDAKLLHAAITRWTEISKLNVIDEFTHECLAIRIARKLKAIDVIDAPSHLFILRGVPGHIRSDNGPEFVAKAVQEWITAVGAKTAYITPGSPWENGYIESSNARLRDELLDGEIFYTLREAQIVIESWRRHFNTIRPHESLGYKPPAPEVFVPAFAA
jgi:transposase InsO family protein